MFHVICNTHVDYSVNTFFEIGFFTKHLITRLMPCVEMSEPMAQVVVMVVFQINLKQFAAIRMSIHI